MSVGNESKQDQVVQNQTTQNQSTQNQPTQNQNNQLAETSSTNKPSFIANLPPTDMMQGIGDMGQFSQPPRLKIIQDQTKAPFKPPFKSKDCITLPKQTKIADGENPFSFTPILFWGTYQCLNPYKLKGTLPFIREFSNDDNSELAKKCRTIGYKESFEHGGQKYDLTFTPFLNFLVVIHESMGNGEISPVPYLMWAKMTEIKYHQVLMNMIQGRGAPIYAGRYRAIIGEHPTSQNTVYGFDFSNDHEPWVSEQQFNLFKKLHEINASVVRAGAMKPDYEDDDVTSAPAAEESAF